jgi:coenzyme F420-reducing hydrogenase gamma subunit
VEQASSLFISAQARCLCHHNIVPERLPNVWSISLEPYIKKDARCAMSSPIKLAVWKFASCDGCQLSLLDLEDQLLPLAEKVHIAYFLEASRDVDPGPYDLSLVEGSITTAEDAERIKKVRKLSKLVVPIGACATAGGIQALRNFTDVNNYIPLVYAHPEYIKTLQTSTPIAENIKVDFEIQGCPINKMQLLQVIKDLLQGRAPRLSPEAVCVACKNRGNICVMVADGQPCLGPVTHAGCGALCPTYRRGCYGCFGPKDRPNMASLTAQFQHMGVSEADIVRMLRTFNAYKEPFRQESLIHEQNH